MGPEQIGLGQMGHREMGPGQMSPGQMGPRTKGSWTNGSETNGFWTILSQDPDYYSTGMSITKMHGGSPNKYVEKSDYIFMNPSNQILKPILY